MATVNVYSLDGSVLRQVELPPFFTATYREDLIKRAVLSDESKEYQPKGNYKFAGLETSARYVGRKEIFGSLKNRGIPHLPREVLPNGQYGKVRRVPHAVKGRRAHPPKPEKKIVEEINKKEYKKALISALSASANKEIIKKNRHVETSLSLPIIVDNSFEKLKKTKDIVKFFDALKLTEIVEKSRKNGTKGPLVIAGGDVLKAASNIPGVDAISADALKVKHLAPGTHAGRILIISENGLSKLRERLMEL